MKKHFSKYWYLYLIAVAIILIIAKVVKDRNPPRKNSKGVSGSGTGEVSFTTEIDENIILRHGSQGSEVRELQVILNDMLSDSGYTGVLIEDGDFGNLTLTALSNMAGRSETTLAEMGY